jgi:chromosome segregation ATPase
VTTTPQKAAHMIDARRRDSATKRARIVAALERLQDQDMPITFVGVARQADVSTWLVYAPGIRERIEKARAQQRIHGTDPDPRDAATRGLDTDLALARAEIRKLRAERDHQRQQLRLALGARMDNLAKADLVTRVEELTHTNTELAATVEKHRRDNDNLHARITELEDDLAAARTSLRRMIRAENSRTDA